MQSEILKSSDFHMGLALEEAENAFRIQEVPVGAVVIDETGKVISRAHNLKEQNQLPTHHAEVIAVEKACKKIGNWRLNGCTLFVTLEPCPMCLSMLVQARVKNLVFGAYDKKGGAISLGYDLYKDKRLNHRFSVIGGISHYECGKILSEFFKQNRKIYK